MRALPGGKRRLLNLIAWNAFGVAIALAVGLLIGEVALRAIGFEFTLYPTRVQFGYPTPTSIHSFLRLDRDLLWVPRDYETRTSAARPTIVFMGDSCTRGGHYDEELEQIINDNHPSNNFTYANLGVWGWSSYQGLRQLERDVVRMGPEFITVYFGWNDHWDSYGIQDKDIGEFNLEHPEALVRLSQNSRVAQAINRAVVSIRYDGFSQRPKRVSMTDFGSNLRRIVQIARDNDITPILLTAPTSHRRGMEPSYLEPRWLTDVTELVPLHEAYAQVVRDVAAEENALIVDLHAEFKRISTEELGKLFKTDGIHLMPEGDRKIAEIIYNYLEEQGLVNQLTGDGEEA